MFNIGDRVISDRGRIYIIKTYKRTHTTLGTYYYAEPTDPPGNYARILIWEDHVRLFNQEPSWEV